MQERPIFKMLLVPTNVLVIFQLNFPIENKPTDIQTGHVNVASLCCTTKHCCLNNNGLVFVLCSFLLYQISHGWHLARVWARDPLGRKQSQILRDWTCAVYSFSGDMRSYPSHFLELRNPSDEWESWHLILQVLCFPKKYLVPFT